MYRDCRENAESVRSVFEFETFFADGAQTLSSKSGLRVFQGFFSRVFLVVLVLGLLTCALVVGSLQRLDRATQDDARINARLFVVLDQAEALIEDVLKLSHSAQTDVVTFDHASADDALKQIDAGRVALLRSSEGTELAGRAATLSDAVEIWQTALRSLMGATGPTLNDTGQKLRLSETNVVSLGWDFSRFTGQRSNEILDRQHQTSNSKTLIVGAELSLGLIAILCVLGWSSRKVLARTNALPVRFERMVFDESPVEAKPSHRWGKDPIDQAASKLWKVALKLRSNLSENKRIERMAFTDPLTGLPNRRGLLAFLDLLAESGDDPDDAASKIGLVHIDLDHFKTINDTMGHDAGDTVLKGATRRMSTAIRDSDLLARLGGDEFLIVSTGIETESDLTRIADRLLEQFSSPIMYHKKVCQVGVSMGLVLGGQRGRVRDPKRLLINADMALFRAKSQGRGQFAIFNSAMADEERRRNERSIALAKALQDNAFRPWFQPMIDLQQNRVSGLELLSRWHDETRGVLMPGDFLADAEAHSLMEEIGLQVLEHAIIALQAWRISGASVPVVHLNLSRTQLLSSSFVDRLSWKLDEANMPPGQFAIEVDEKDCNARGGEVAFANIRRLRDMGLNVVLDNFGADQASLSILGPLRARSVKCSPKTFEQILQNHAEPDKVRALSALGNAAKEFGLSISAKGVETADQSSLILKAGINVQQGDYLAGVLDAEDTGKFLRGELADSRRVREAV